MTTLARKKAAAELGTRIADGMTPWSGNRTVRIKTLSGSPNTFAIIMQDGVKGMEVHFDAHALDSEEDLELIVAMALETWKNERERDRRAGH